MKQNSDYNGSSLLAHSKSLNYSSGHEPVNVMVRIEFQFSALPYCTGDTRKR